MRPLRWLLALAVLASPTLNAQTRTYAGMFTSNWKTIGPHGHDQPWCADPIVVIFPNGAILTQGVDCNREDFARGNLDNSLGFRAGLERVFLAGGPFALVGGVEGSLSHTEYNLTQIDIAIASVAATAGADLRLGPVTIGGRYGIGGFGTSDQNEFGVQQHIGLEVTVPIRADAGLRVSHRSSQLREDIRVTETSFLLVTSPEHRAASSKWEFAASTGTSTPGSGPLGSSRGLSAAAYSKITAWRDLPWHRLQARLSWAESGHESSLPSTFLGYDDNYRSKTIDGYALGVSRITSLGEHFSVRYGAGVEVSDWRDEHYLLTRYGEEIVAGIEPGWSGDAAVRWHFAPNLALEGSLEKLYWQRLDLGETRWGFGLVVTK